MPVVTSSRWRAPATCDTRQSGPTRDEEASLFKVELAVVVEIKESPELVHGRARVEALAFADAELTFLEPVVDAIAVVVNERIRRRIQDFVDGGVARAASR